MTEVEIIPRYVETIPKPMEPGILYISKKYGVANHLCLCGCGDQSVTPFEMQPNEKWWNLIENDGKVSIQPSILNHPCEAHYVITDNLGNFIEP